MSSRGDLTRRGVLGLAMAGALAGCGLEADSKVRPGLPLDGVPRDRTNRIPNRPSAGASPEEIILGFLHAGATSGDGLERTQLYLTDVLKQQGWLPDSQTVIYAGDEPKITALKSQPDTYRVRVRVTATIDGEGRYTVAPPNLWQTFDFALQQVSGEWRIDELEDGFGRLLQPHEVNYFYEVKPVHYPAIGWNALVVDQRWFPQDQLATRVVRAQLGRIPEYLEKAVFPRSGAELAVDAVPVRNGVAQVDLNSSTVPDDATTRKQLVAQLVATLRKVDEVTEVVVTLSGNLLDVGVDEPLEAAEQLGFMDRTQTNAPIVLARQGTKVVRAGDRLASLTDEDVEEADSSFAPLTATSRLLGLRPDGKEIAEVNAEGKEVARYRDDETVVSVPPFAADMVRPSYDYHGVLWLGGSGLGRETGNRLWAVNTDVDPENLEEAAPRRVPAKWLGERLVIAAAVSPEGRRIAVISEARRGTGSTLEVAGVVRRSNGLPTETSSLSFRLAANLVEMIDVVWVGNTTLAVLGRRDDETTMQPHLVEVGGRVSRLPARPGTALITTTGDDKDVVLTSRKGRVFQRAGGRWQELTAISGVVTAGV